MFYVNLSLIFTIYVIFETLNRIPHQGPDVSNVVFSRGFLPETGCDWWGNVSTGYSRHSRSRGVQVNECGGGMYQVTGALVHVSLVHMSSWYVVINSGDKTKLVAPPSASHFFVSKGLQVSSCVMYPWWIKQIQLRVVQCLKHIFGYPPWYYWNKA